MDSTWILVANASTARLYTGDPRRKLSPVREFSHPASREKAAALVTDQPGHGVGHGAFVPASNPKELEAEAFAGELAQEIERGRVSGECRRVVLVMPASFLGLVNKRLSDAARALVSSTVQKDYTKADGQELGRHLAEALSLK